MQDPNWLRLAKIAYMMDESEAIDELYNLYFIENLSQKEISELLGLTRPYVCRLMKKYKLSKKNKI